MINKEIQWIFWCDGCHRTFTVENTRVKRKAIREARANDWKVDREDNCTCPSCQREKVLGQ